LKIRAKNNPIENFKYAFDEVFIQTLIDRMDANQDIFEKIMLNSEFKEDVKNWLTKKIYERMKED
jgi:type I restriction enzyme R subunit